MAIHLRPPVARRLMRPTRGLGSAPFRQAGWSPSYLALLQVELARFTPTLAGIVTVALVLALRRTGVTRYLALWSSDFPHAGRVAPSGAQPSGHPR